ncbi:ATP-binding protein [Streptomyces sp. NPDC005374]|uniref:ATP-binding protein n=1 Tax=Streptomyces sp. NPDC005374 TaxID=3364713 RepID=UPI00369CB136
MTAFTHNPDQDHAAVTGEPAAPKRCTAGSGRGPLEKEPHSGNLASGLPVLTHGRVPGHDFGLRVALDAATGLVRVEVSDAASTKRPPATPPSSIPEGESGRGLLLVDTLAVRWGSVPRRPLGKTVWAEVSIA